MPAEWEEATAVLLAWPHSATDWQYMLPQAETCYLRLVDTISRYTPVIVAAPHTESVKTLIRQLPYRHRIHLAGIDTNDTWTRDYGPITVRGADGTDRALAFGFNGWGLKFAANFDNQVTAALFSHNILNNEPENHKSFILEGGSIESDGRGTILTTSRCLMSPNRNGSYTKAAIENELKQSLGASRVLWLDYGGITGDDTDGHIDTIARMAPDDTIVYVAPGEPDSPDYSGLKAMSDQLGQFTTQSGAPYRLVALPAAPNIFDADDGRRLPATYANFLALKNVVIMPSYNNPDTDHKAACILREVFNRPVEEVDCTALIRQNGSLHCATMQIPLTLLNL